MRFGSWSAGERYDAAVVEHFWCALMWSNFVLHSKLVILIFTTSNPLGTASLAESAARERLR